LTAFPDVCLSRLGNMATAGIVHPKMEILNIRRIAATGAGSAPAAAAAAAAPQA
jgi:hypothetical protein